MPNFDVVLHEDPALLPGRWKSLFESTDSVCIKCDIARYAFVLNEGGFYLDLDMTPLQSFEYYVPYHFGSIWATLQTDVDRMIACPDSAFFAAKRNDELLEKVLDSIQPEEGKGCLHTSACFHLSNVLKRQLGLNAIPHHLGKTENVGDTFFLPILAFGAKNYGYFRHLSPERLASKVPTAFAHHGFAGSWSDKTYPPRKATE